MQMILHIPSWHTTLKQRWVLVAFCSRRRIMLSQRCHNILFLMLLLRPKPNFVTTLCFRRRLSDLVLMLQQYREFQVVSLTKI